MLTSKTVNNFLQELGSASPTPGGGSAAALAGALASSLCSMVASLTLGREKYRDAWPEMQAAEEKGHALTATLLELMDQDADAYDAVMGAMKMPKATEEEKELREQRIQESLKEACKIPLKTVEAVAEVGRLVESVLFKGNPNAITDAGSAGRLAWAAAHAAAYNVEINLKAVKDPGFVAETRKKLEFELAQVEASAIISEAEMLKQLS